MRDTPFGYDESKKRFPIGYQKKTNLAKKT